MRGGNISRALRTAKAQGGGVFHGYIPGATGGRTDNKDMQVASGSYVIPADILSGIGEGNSHAGADKMMRLLGMGPYDPDNQQQGAQGLPQVASPPLAPKAAGGPMGMPPGIPGGTPPAGEPVPIVAASGEMVVPPHKVTQLGGGDIKRGHNILDSFVKHSRKMNISTLKKLPKPKRD